MFKNNNILVGKNEETESYLLLNKANRHGLITGASGSGKTITLKVLAEGFSSAGVPVILSDVKGDLAGTSLLGQMNEKIEERVTNLKLENFEMKKFPVAFFDVYGKRGHPIRTKVSDVGSKLLARMLGLSDVQEGVLAIVFKVCEDENLELIDLNDLKAALSYIGEKRKELALNYGNVTTQSIGAIQRGILSLIEEGGDKFFGEPSLELWDFIHFDSNTGFGQINIIDSVELFKNPTLYSSVLLWLLTNLYNKMPEVGDLEKPKLVLFIDEAHLVFSEIPSYLLKNITQIVKLIRSKGIGLYFISQTPKDIPVEILGQLGNRIQHVLRTYTKADEEIVKAAADSYRDNPKFDTKEAIQTLAIGEALVSFQTENGEVSMVERVTILPPQSKMGTIEDALRSQLISESWLYGKYENRVDKVSASEIIINKKEESEALKNAEKEKKEKEKQAVKDKKEAEKYATKIAKKTVNSVERKLINKFVNKLFK